MSRTDTETSIEGVSLGKVYWDGGRKLEILKDVSLSVRRSEAVAVLGPSGSGKTTLLNLLSGLDPPDAGRVRLAGTDIHALDGAQKARFRNQKVGFVFQFYHLLPEFSALENVMLPLLIGKTCGLAEAAKRADALLKKVGLSDRAGHFPTELSGGEQQRVAIARAIANDPEILFCDEPTGNLDPARAGEVAELLKDLIRREKKTVLIVTHDERIAGIADRVWDLQRRDWVN